MIWRGAHTVLYDGDRYRLMWWIQSRTLPTPLNNPRPAVATGLRFVWRQSWWAVVTGGALLQGTVIISPKITEALIPRSFYFYGEPTLWRVASSRRDALRLIGSSRIGWLSCLATSNGAVVPRIRNAPTWLVVSLYFLCLRLVRRQPSIGPVSETVERALDRLPRSIRGGSRAEAEHAA